jgi:hypothetical protein
MINIKAFPVSSSSLLTDFYKYQPQGVANSTPMISPKLQKETLPNGGGTFTPSGAPVITPAPIFTGAKPVQQAPAPVAPAAAPSKAPSIYDKYRDPKTGEIMTPEEYAIYLGNKIPKGNGEITNYAGDALTNPNQSAEELTKRATALNNSRNDIATGAADPYKVGNQSGVAYSPTELKAIENAYAGVYDPALQDVFARLKTTQDEEKQKANLQSAKELEIFKTNESIRQWRATTGTQKTGGGTAKDLFSQANLNTAARNAGLSIEVIEDMDPDLINFFISPKKATNFDLETEEIGAAYQSWFDAVANGDVSAEEVANNINATSLSPAVKAYYTNQIPAEPAKKEGWIKRVLGAIIGN